MLFYYIDYRLGAEQVETIGDAYMVVGGIPQASTTHAHAVAGFSVGMIQKSQEVKSPATNKPLEVEYLVHIV